MVEKDERLERALRNMRVRIREELSNRRQNVGWCEVHEVVKSPLDEAATAFFPSGYTHAEKLNIWRILSENYIEFTRQTK